MKKENAKKKKGLGIFIILSGILFVILFGITGAFIYKYQESPEDALTCAKIQKKQAQITYPEIESPAGTYIQCQPDGNADGRIVDIVNQQLSYLPGITHRTFTADGWSIYVTDMNIGQIYYPGLYGHVMATTNYNEHRILIESRTDAAYESPLHEIGHWFDYYLGFPSNKEEFAAIYNSESSSFIRAYDSTCVRDVMEFFAEGFWQYTINPDRLKSTSPELYHFIKRQYCKIYIQQTTWATRFL